ncbi:MAG: hypothetical protein WAU68_15650 [Vitreimonas sp.]
MFTETADPLFGRIVAPHVDVLREKLNGLRYDSRLHRNVEDWMVQLNLDGALPGLIDIHRLYAEFLQVQADERLCSDIHFADFVLMLTRQLGLHGSPIRKTADRTA